MHSALQKPGLSSNFTFYSNFCPFTAYRPNQFYRLQVSWEGFTAYRATATTVLQAKILEITVYNLKKWPNYSLRKKYNPPSYADISLIGWR